MHLNVSIFWIYSKTVKRRTLESDIWIRILTLPFGFVTQAKSSNSDEPSIPILKTREIVCNYHPHPHPHPQQHHVSIATTHSKSQGEQTPCMVFATPTRKSSLEGFYCSYLIFGISLYLSNFIYFLFLLFFLLPNHHSLQSNPGHPENITFMFESDPRHPSHGCV